MDDATKFIRLFGDHQGRATAGGRLLIRDGVFIADLKARLSGLAALDNRARGSGWLIDFSPTRTDDLTERSLFEAKVVSAVRGELRLPVRVARDWVEVGEGVLEGSARTDTLSLDAALERAFRRMLFGGSAAGAASPEPARATA